MQMSQGLGFGYSWQRSSVTDMVVNCRDHCVALLKSLIIFCVLGISGVPVDFTNSLVTGISALLAG